MLMTNHCLTGFLITLFAFNGMAFSAPDINLILGFSETRLVVVDENNDELNKKITGEAPGRFCVTPDFGYACPPGCFCQGGDSCTSLSNTKMTSACSTRTGATTEQLSAAGVSLCPAAFPHSNKGASMAAQCYFKNVSGVHIYNIAVTCPAGKYLPKGANFCYTCKKGFYCEGVNSVTPSATSDQGIKACASGKTTKTTGSTKASECTNSPKKSCSAGTYSEDGSSCIECPGGFYCEGGNKGATPCPSPTPEHWCEPSNYPENWYGRDGENAVEILSSSYIPTWDSLKGMKKVSDCRMVYHAKNQRGTFTDESMKWNSATGRYDIGGHPYYKTLKPGFYLKDKLAETYCDKKYFDDGKTKKSMLYTTVITCPADKYCPGMPKLRTCDSGTYEDVFGLEDAHEVTCPAGQYLPKHTELCDKCPGGHTCPGGTYLTKHVDQGAYIAFTQQQLMYGANGKVQTEPEGGYCWKSIDVISYKECMLGAKE